jgi:hypothetical protein
MRFFVLLAGVFISCGDGGGVQVYTCLMDGNQPLCSEVEGDLTENDVAQERTECEGVGGTFMAGRCDLDAFGGVLGGCNSGKPLDAEGNYVFIIWMYPGVQWTSTAEVMNYCEINGEQFLPPP